MLEEFLRYSYRHGRAIRIMYMQDCTVLTRTVTVLELKDTSIVYRAGARGKPKSLDKSNLLSATYARGDEGSLAEGTDTQ